MPVNPAMAQNDAVTIRLSKNQASVVIAQSGAGNIGTAVLVLEGTVNEADWVSPLAMTDPTSTASALVANLTGANKSGIAQTTAWTQVRLRRSDATGGACSGALEAREF